MNKKIWSIFALLFAMPLLFGGTFNSIAHAAISDPMRNGQLFIKLSNANLDDGDVDVKATRLEKNGDAQSNFSLVYDSDKKEWKTKDSEPIVPYGGTSFAGCDQNSDKNKYRVTVTGSHTGESNGAILVCPGFVDGGTITVSSANSPTAKGVITGTLVISDGRKFQGNTSRVTLTSPQRTIKNYDGDDRDNGAINQNWVTDGNLRIPNVPPGTYQLYVSYVDLGESQRQKYVIEVSDIVVEAGSTNNIGTKTAVVKEIGSGDDQNEAAEEEPNCENAGALGWIFCPVIYLLDNGLNWVDNAIASLLDIDRGYYENEGIKGAWTVIRNIAYLILIPVMLVMVIGTAVGFAAIDAYTVKRALPRLVAAVIFISLSYEITSFLIEIFNAIGQGTLGLLTAPFGEVKLEGNETVVVSELTLRHLFGPSLMTSFLGVIASIPGLIIIIWLFWAPLLLFAVTAFLVLLLRQIFIVAFTLLAPLAILAWIFPGNDKLWKTWWGGFSKLLMMFPIIMGVIAVGRIFAAIIHESNPAGFDGAVLAPLMTMTAYLIPYAFIPFTFKFAGGVFSTVTGGIDGMINSEGRKKARAVKRAEKLQAAQDNHAFNERRGGWRGAIAKRANTIASVYTSNPWQTANVYGFGRGSAHATARGRDILSRITQAKLQDTQKMAEALQGAGITVDRGLSTLAGGNKLVNKELNNDERKPFKIRTQADLDKAISILETKGDEQDKIGAQQLRTASNFILSAHRNPEYGRGSLEGAALMNWSAQGFADPEDVVDVSNEIGGDFGNLVANQASYLAYSRGGRLDHKPTYGVVSAGPGQGVTTAPIERQKELVKGLKGHEWQQAKSSAVKSLRPAIEAVVAEGGEVGITMAQTVASNAVSGTDPNSKAKWRELAREIFKDNIEERKAQMEASGREPMTDEAALDEILYERVYGRGGAPEAARRAAQGEPGGPTGPPDIPPSGTGT